MMRGLLKRLLKNDKATGAVEFTLLLPVLLAVVFGIVELGGAWNAKQMLVHASREGARYGVLMAGGGVTDAQVEDRVELILQTAGFPGNVVVSSSGASGASGSLVQVDVSANYTFPVISSLMSVAPSVTLQATTVMRHE